MVKSSQWRLEYHVTGTAPSIYLLDDKPFLVGRNEQCTLILSSNSVSRKHCSFTISENDLFVEDLDSKNGTFVNGRRIKERCRLVSGDTVAVGKAELIISYGPAESDMEETKLPRDGKEELFASVWNLSKREIEVVFFILKGKTSQEIADRLFISTGTVKNHISSIYRKTNTKSRLQLAELYKSTH